MRLNRRDGDLSWRQVVEMALRPPAGRRQGLVAAMRVADEENIHERLVFYAVRRVAREQGNPLATPAAYDRGRDRLLRRDRARHRHGGTEHVRLPTANQLVEWAKRTRRDAKREPWHLVLEAAGLPAPPARKGATKNLSPGAGGSVRRGLDVAVALAESARANDRWASKRTLTAFCRNGGVALSRTIGKPWAEYLAEASAILERSGDPLPSDQARPTGRGNKVTYVVPEGGLQAALEAHSAERLRASHKRGQGADATPAAPRSKWPPERVVEKLAEFDRITPRSQGRSQGVYRRYLPDHPDWPQVSTVIKRGGWTKLMNEAKRRRKPDR
jgi:hypothetical protein